MWINRGVPALGRWPAITGLFAVGHDDNGMPPSEGDPAPGFEALLWIGDDWISPVPREEVEAAVADL